MTDQTFEKINKIGLDWLLPNPYQTREREDPAHVAKIAESILQEGILQPPVGRQVAWSKVELAFGHTRLAAYKLLTRLALQGASDGLDLTEYPGLAKMFAERVAGTLDNDRRNAWLYLPVMIRSLGEEEMFRLAVTENLARKNLTPIEEAKAMQRYRTEFNKTSVEIGALFGINESTVRNKMRLLELPEAIRDQVATGQVSEGTARMLLSAQRAAPAAVQAAATDIAAQGLESPAAIAEKIRRKIYEAGAFEMCGNYRSDGLAGQGLWSFGWAMGEHADALKPMSMDQVNKAFELIKLKSFEHKPAFKALWDLAAAKNIKDLSAALSTSEDAQRIVDALIVLARPPACTACPFYTRLEGYHYCGLKACWQRKKEIWMGMELVRMCMELDIPVYDREVDGSPYEDLRSYDSNDQELWKQKPDSLRLVPRYSEYNENSFTKSYTVAVVSVDKKKQEAARKKNEEDKRRENESRDANKAYQAEQRLADLANSFFEEVAGPVFSHSLDGLSDGAVEILLRGTFHPYQVYPMKRRCNDNIRAAYWALFMEFGNSSSLVPYSVRKQGPVEAAKHLRGVAMEWGNGIELPADWLELAERCMDPEHISGN